jgi:NAD(P)H-dependent flavin oxidoreductase YrpB (nitropropane dioxygenase family)
MAQRLRGRLRLPRIGAPLFIVSNPELVIAQCKAGIVGSFPALNARPKEKLDEWLVTIKSALAEHDAAHPEAPAAPFAVNQIVHRSNDRLMHDLEACVRHQVWADTSWRLLGHGVRRPWADRLMRPAPLRGGPALARIYAAGWACVCSAA